ncbi:hypothetical protein SEA_SONALI_10 [Arthrobacter phage Sonali]|uniref:Tail terminator n=1 Tax=Arthrobacter phage Sonali TaxID=2510495 RepID=A0A411CQX6_9CAUD|nr:hypothetical protein HOV09_gp10 [Arthrobacter phage Sonali]QAY16123.1 hypothetical protein SEA_SONALI_10 [Arthrobacter phage Sonali]
MSAKSVRQAIADYLRPTQGISKMFRDEPWIVTSEAWTQPDGLPGTVAYVHIDREAETRYALAGANPFGIGKALEYMVSIVVLYQYDIPDQPDDKDSWVDGLDELLDALKARVRADPTLGTGPGGVIWQAGEGGHMGGPDLEVQRDLPKLHHGKVLSWNALQFKVTEMVGTDA